MWATRPDSVLGILCAVTFVASLVQSTMADPIKVFGGGTIKRFT